MAFENNLATQKRFAEAVMTRDLRIFDEVVASNAIDHDPAPDQGPGPEGYRHFFGELLTAFPDLNLTIEHMVADEDNIAFAYMMTGTHQGTFMGLAPTNKPIRVRGIQISKFANGKLVERWGSSDQLGILQQLDCALPHNLDKQLASGKP
ncbi:hypothetical protein KDA_71980 [Dictyobacter alpinus]|uniref:Ester cyclase n=1 Tax=Dictyobacter alpinus TaxID=2014873 RepID=A0A402BK49_9CHLR|nr:ester cyclase [Dictyobacter alpinus]GCE31714.1 hypothetical protein KDA_71980 [Dictyobacter alpinus]